MVHSVIVVTEAQYRAHPDDPSQICNSLVSPDKGVPLQLQDDRFEMHWDLYWRFPHTRQAPGL